LLCKKRGDAVFYAGIWESHCGEGVRLLVW